MWFFNKTKRLEERVKELEYFNEQLLAANRQLFDMYRRERSDLDAHSQDCVHEFCIDKGIPHTLIKTPGDYVKWITHQLLGEIK